ncbi:hypothetical protein TVAG_479120 [Trichomonas vaginalis G3]|uniref:Uncharacterized protein n=2 Tax=Trichomonas vaginalis (strain ATCC PRA-98 / G3) TaxID=412133 RepID=A2FVQ2_TRIV3|nr:hypothetical protein TVAG_479120 [Trichomonas vaginalis G3]|eukprot:XP_001303934.1 hypothetical protein [Trichomonas vaginalis G3]
MKEQIKSSNEQIEKLKNLLFESQNTVKEANNTIEAKEQQISQEQNKLQDHLNQIKQYEAKLTETVPKIQYEALQKKYSTQSSKLLEAIKTLQENETIVNKLRSKLQVSEENREKNGVNASAMVIEVKRLKQQLKEANIEIEVLNQALNGKRKDILSLERGIVNEKRSKAALKVQCYSLAAENQNLTNAVLNQDSIPEQKKVEDVTLQARLKEMSRNLAGTMFN